mmetsp:Transcript_24449/g.68632  ORF Transcript_24449/g.68632 Transcript_24449/m.68632 type:complete len:111 (-) Transcript_24449:26-358(-)
MSTPCSVCTAAWAMSTSENVAWAKIGAPEAARTSGGRTTWPNLDRIFATLEGKSDKVLGSTQAVGKLRITTVDERSCGTLGIAPPCAGTAIERDLGTDQLERRGRPDGAT